MAIRRVQMLTETTYWQALGFPYGQPLAVSAGNAIVTRLSTEPRPITVQLAAQYSQTGNQINLIAYLERIPGQVIPAGSVQFTVTEISGNGAWNPATTQTVAGTQDLTRRWIAQIPADDVIQNVCMGKSTLKVFAVIQRAGNTYKKEIYVNHLGIGEAAAWLRNRLNYVEATKRDETS
jgi:hypothetical protein